MNQNWSDSESSDEENELVQPNRDFPISDEEEIEDEIEDEEFDTYELAQKTLKNKVDDFFKQEDKKQPININNKPINKIINKEVPILIKEKRKFNPRLPPPNKYNKSYDNKKFNFNLNDFPTL